MDGQSEYFYNSFQHESFDEKEIRKSLHSSFGGEIDHRMDIDFITVNFSEFTVDRYNSNGILKKSFDFKHLKKEYGQAVSVSNNGHLFIFKKKK
jgi:hypothetical protein